MWSQAYANWLLLTNPPRHFDHLHRTGWYCSIFNDWIADLAIPKNASVIDVGCGPGALTLELRERGVEAIGIDRAKGMLNFAKKQGLTKGYENIFHRADARALPYPDGAFKFAMAASFINVVPNPVAALRELIRVTKPSGTLSVLLPNATMTPANSQQYSAEHRLARRDCAIGGSEVI